MPTLKKQYSLQNPVHGQIPQKCTLTCSLTIYLHKGGRVMSQLMFLQAINQALREELRRDEKVILMGEDVHTGTFGETKGIFEEFGPERVMSTPISESGFTGTAVGAAIGGMRPVVEFMVSDFMFVAMDQLVNQAAKTRYMTGGQATIPVTFMALNMGGGGCRSALRQYCCLFCAHARTEGGYAFNPL